LTKAINQQKYTCVTFCAKSDQIAITFCKFSSTLIGEFIQTLTV